MSQQFFAQLDENDIVIDVHCVTQEFLKTNPERYPGIWVETFFETAGKIYAGLGYKYDYETENFIQPPKLIVPEIE